MNEQEWLACDKPHWMLNHLRPWKSRGRKMCLYVGASCRRPDVWDRLKEPCRILLDVAERHTAGLVGWEEYTGAKQAVSKMTKLDKRVGGEHWPPLFGQVLLNHLRLKHLPGWEGVAPLSERFNYLGNVARRNREVMRSMGVEVITEERAVELQKEYDVFMADHINFLRDLFGNPFRPVTIAPAWQSPTVLGLAQAAYDNRILPAGTLDPARFAVLADALEDNGCDNADILAHCRQPGKHVWGCWLVDLF